MVKLSETLLPSVSRTVVVSERLVDRQRGHADRSKTNLGTATRQRAAKDFNIVDELARCGRKRDRFRGTRCGIPGDDLMDVGRAADIVDLRPNLIA